MRLVHVLALAFAWHLAGCASSTDSSGGEGSTTPALSGIVFYSDAGASRLANSWAGWTANSAGGSVALETSDQPGGGTDRIALDVPGGWWSLVVWDPANMSRDVSAMNWLIFDVRRVAGSATSMQVGLGDLASDDPTSALQAVTVDGTWRKVALPLTGFARSGFNPSAVHKVFFRHAVEGAIGLRIDNIRFAQDSAGDGTIERGGVAPAVTSGNLLLGVYWDMGAPDFPATHPDISAFDVRYNYLDLRALGSYGPGYVGDFVRAAQAAQQTASFTIYGGFGTTRASVTAAMADPAVVRTFFAAYSAILDTVAAVDATLPLILTIEPDLLGFLVQAGWTGSSSVAMASANQLLGTTYPATLAGWAQAVVAQAHRRLPRSVVGHVVSHWSIPSPGLGNASAAAHQGAGLDAGRLLLSFGTGKGDVFFVEKSDRDAGYWSTSAPAAQRTSAWHWDASDYANYLLWIRTISGTAGLRCIPWQISVGTSGNANTPQNYRDDFVQRVAQDPRSFVEAGVVGVLFGRGAGPSGGANPGESAPAVHQTEIWTDQGRFLSVIRGMPTIPLP